MSGLEQLARLAEAVSNYETEEAVALAEQAIADGADPVQLIEQGLAVGLQAVSDRYSCGDAYLPELMLAGETADSVVKVLEPALNASGGQRKVLGRIIIGTVKGDIHDIGKKIVGMMWQAAGFEVIDIGLDVPASVFVEKVKELQPDIVGASAMITTTVGEQKVVAEALAAAGVRDQVKYMIGGAAVSPQWSAEIGADGFADNAVAAVAKAKALLGA
jgi:corrinoid protein of di/trimethylamine methyltransferase